MKKKKPITAGELVRRFGISKSGKSAQQMKDEAREGWISYSERTRRKK
jgi:hypothetical protein